ncbi:unnamed protein product [Mytilus edulis]|uniref:DZIP3-like HEPN domain-containing protein n=1 Tax=Mytilus edulis TaxID=6550 RepID=A0A8S3T3D0_MYTED|nr:unnamed protein product [Mytilus edulis]
MELLLTGISPSAVRVSFDKEFHPSCLETSIKKEYNTLFDLKKKRSINTEQWKLLFPSGGNPKSTSFDVPLMITLLRNLAKLTPPTCGYDHLPLSTDTTPTADLARIKYYRNELAHNKTAKIKSEFFATAWDNISEAVTRLGGQHMKEECKELRKSV